MRIDKIVESVKHDLTRRSQVGIIKYNTTLDENNADNFLNHLYEELLDAALYTKKQITILTHINELIKKYPNDEELGNEIRKIYSK